MNSVSPSTMPSKMIVRREASILIRQSRQRRCGSRSVGRLDREAAVAAVGGEPAFGDGGERSRRDAELFEALGARRDEIVVLQHQPQVPGHRRAGQPARSEEHTPELQSPMRKSYAALCLKKKE